MSRGRKREVGDPSKFDVNIPSSNERIKGWRPPLNISDTVVVNRPN